MHKAGQKNMFGSDYITKIYTVGRSAIYFILCKIILRASVMVGKPMLLKTTHARAT